MHTYSFSIYLLYLKCVWNLSNCLFLSLSFLFLSTPSQNPLPSMASSSSDPTPSHIQFHDEDARRAFSENFSRQGIHSEHQVILADFVNTNLPDVIYSRGWESLCDDPVTCPSVLIQEFNSNMHGFNFSVSFFHTRVRGTCIVVTP